MRLGNLLAYLHEFWLKSLVYCCEITLVLKVDKIGYFDMGFSPQIRKFPTIGIIKGSCWRTSGIEFTWNALWVQRSPAWNCTIPGVMVQKSLFCCM